MDWWTRGRISYLRNGAPNFDLGTNPLLEGKKHCFYHFLKWVNQPSLWSFVKPSSRIQRLECANDHSMSPKLVVLISPKHYMHPFPATRHDNNAHSNQKGTEFFFDWPASKAFVVNFTLMSFLSEKTNVFVQWNHFVGFVLRCPAAKSHVFLSPSMHISVCLFSCIKTLPLTE